MNSRDIAEKKDLWNELNDLWIQRQMRRRKGRLSLLAALSVIVVAGAVMYAASFPAPEQSLFMQIKGQKLDKGVVERSSTEQGNFRTHSTVEAAETITI
ncbi:MAG: hypothetical protein RBR02_06645 [Desulfuromonadaceae bacterium]|nr:hypothetical protein [Desulfuromonadaceae bacterium]